MIEPYGYSSKIVTALGSPPYPEFMII